MHEYEIIFRAHAILRMFERDVSEIEVRAVLESGQVIEDYPGDSPYPSRLMLGFVDIWGSRRPLHVLVSFDHASRMIFVVTVYVPTLARWEAGFRRRRQP